MTKGEFSDLAVEGALIAVRVQPRARRNEVTREEGGLRVQTTAAPEDGKANAAVVDLVARAIGVPRSRIVLERGATSRQKLLRVL